MKPSTQFVKTRGPQNCYQYKFALGLSLPFSTRLGLREGFQHDQAVIMYVITSMVLKFDKWTVYQTVMINFTSTYNYDGFSSLKGYPLHSFSFQDCFNNHNWRVSGEPTLYSKVPFLWKQYQSEGRQTWAKIWLPFEVKSENFELEDEDRTSFQFFGCYNGSELKHSVEKGTGCGGYISEILDADESSQDIRAFEILCFAKPLPLSCNSTRSEIYGLLWVAQLAHIHDLFPLALMTDYLYLASALRMRTQFHNPEMMKDLVRILDILFHHEDSWEVYWLNEKENTRAHTLANKASKRSTTI